MDEADPGIRYLSIRFTRESLDEVDVDGKTRLVCLPRAAITSIDLAHGQSEERPLAQIVTGLVLVALGLVFVARIVHWLWLGGTIFDLEALGVAFLPLGVWFVVRVLRKRHYLLVRTAEEARKLAFNGQAERARIVELLERARRDYAYPIAPPEP